MLPRNGCSLLFFTSAPSGWAPILVSLLVDLVFLVDQIGADYIAQSHHHIAVVRLEGEVSIYTGANCACICDFPHLAVLHGHAVRLARKALIMFFRNQRRGAAGR